MKRIEWSYFKPEDWPYVLALHIEQERKLGRQMDLPDLSKRPVVSCLVGRTDGRITDCIFTEAELEVCALGDKALSSRDVREAMALLIRDAQYYGIRITRAFVPKRALKQGPRRKARKAPVQRILEAAGFTEVDETMVDFYRWIPQAKDSGR